MSYLLDTNIVIGYLASSLPSNGMKTLNAIVDDDSIISVITKIETLGFNFKSVSEKLNTEVFVNGSTILNIDDAIVSRTIVLRKTHKIKLPDAIIAATALVHGLILISRNTKDFVEITGLRVINPYDL